MARLSFQCAPKEGKPVKSTVFDKIYKIPKNPLSEIKEGEGQKKKGEFSP